METLGLCALGLTGGMFIASRLRAKTVASKWAIGGFQAKMDKKEALQILGLREQLANTQRIKHAHRTIMLANHPDKGGSPFLASKINEAKDLLEKQASK
ncbi:hypothetical protein WALSEDRAFT_31329 [Wallemia mellicola CBS 633.66]|uniref:Mitochondrial import inner membrane translocase subunit TIM14 n=1 Tax=Wallemia mellicola (strain ATCC MYA-4683 / CBS 633.66) TaxID=671144 RepID=I4YGR0_WALMC|nr:hypothetical protein WALSEDRAFT_31329 [Wallemia mellicola CBS 633.66]EIM23152.1 hypothetical protein WALSEDRAFT_31329 [Wallemia mellicola CBS 633.66]|eukprot:XP_006956548.1 hypothetical protein WALSEDRAFT_31329 [Wallemia mellicola CBS 633.66]